MKVLMMLQFQAGEMTKKREREREKIKGKFQHL
jgi:hypothetical protein